MAIPFILYFSVPTVNKRTQETGLSLFNLFHQKDKILQSCNVFRNSYKIILQAEETCYCLFPVVSSKGSNFTIMYLEFLIKSFYRQWPAIVYFHLFLQKDYILQSCNIFRHSFLWKCLIFDTRQWIFLYNHTTSSIRYREDCLYGLLGNVLISMSMGTSQVSASNNLPGPTSFNSFSPIGRSSVL